MKEIAETFGLWDEVYQKEVVKELEAVHVSYSKSLNAGIKITFLSYFISEMGAKV